MSKFFRLMYLLIFAMIGLVGVLTNDISGQVDEEFGFVVLVIFSFLIAYIIDVAVYANSKGVINPETFFVSLFSMFHFAYVVLYYFGLAEYDGEIFYKKESLISALYYSLLCVVLFVLGYRMRWSSVSNYGEHKVYDMNDYFRVMFYSKILLILAFLMFWVPILIVLPAVYGDYKALTSIGTISPLGRLFWVGQYIGYSAVALYFVAKRFSGHSYDYGYFHWLVVLYASSYLLIGDRGGFISYLTIILLTYNYYHKKISIKKISVMMLAILVVSSFIAVSRVEFVFNPLEVFDVYVMAGKGNPVVEALIEFGGSIKTVAIAMYYVPDSYGFWYGKSFFDSFLNVLPNFFGDARSASVGVGAFVTQVAFGSLADTHGRGGSIVMEAYINFGIAGCFLFLFLGFFLRKYYGYFLYSKSLTSSVVFLTSISGVSMWMRNTSSMTFRIVIWSMIITYCIHLVSRNKSQSFMARKQFG